MTCFSYPAMSPITADITIRRIGEIFFFSTFLPPKYIRQSITVIKVFLVLSTDPGMQFLMTMHRPVARMIPITHGLRPLSAA